MTIGTYGLSSQVAQNPVRLGSGLSGLAGSEEQQATAMLRTAAQNEQALKLKNEEAERTRKAGNAQLGSSVGMAAGMAAGAAKGSVGGLWGAAIGAVVGGLLGGAF